MQKDIISNPCHSYRPGHQVHWIQANHALRAETRPESGRWFDIGVYGTISIDLRDRILTLWNHNPVWLAKFAHLSDGLVQYQPEFHLLWLHEPGERSISHTFSVAKGFEDHAPCRFHPPGTIFGELFGLSSS